MWSGFGVNYKASQVNWDADIAYFKAIGLTNIRPHIPNAVIPWVAGVSDGDGNYAFWRHCAQFFHQAGFWVTWGVSSSITLTSSNWQAYHDSVLAEATYLQQQGIVIDEFVLGNELESRVDGTTLTIAQLQANIRQLASDVKAVYALGQVSYACWNTAGTTYPSWVSGGLGALDTISIHPYGNINIAAQTVADGGFSEIAQMTNVFGSKCYVSEFNIDALASNITALDSTLGAQALSHLFNKYLYPLRVPKAIIYSWVGYLNTNNDFAMKLTDGTFSPSWGTLEIDMAFTATINSIAPADSGALSPSLIFNVQVVFADSISGLSVTRNYSFPGVTTQAAAVATITADGTAYKNGLASLSNLQAKVGSVITI